MAKDISVISPVVSRRTAVAMLGAGLGMLTTRAWSQSGVNQERFKVRMGIISALFDAPSLIALEKGYFNEEGLDVEVTKFATGADEYQAHATGIIDVATSSVNVALLNAKIREIDLSVVAGAGNNTSGHGFISVVLNKELVESGRYKGPADLKGLKMATGVTSAPHWVISEVARKAGLQKNDLKYVSLGFANVVAGITNGAVDGASVAEPLASLLIQRTNVVRVASVDEIFPNSPVGYLVYGPALTKDNVEAGNRFMVGYLKGVRDYGLAFGEAQTNKDEILSILKKYNIEILPDSPSLFIPEDGAPSLEWVDAFIDWQMEMGALRTRLDPQSIVDDRFRQAALIRLGRS